MLGAEPPTLSDARRPYTDAKSREGWIRATFNLCIKLADMSTGSRPTSN